MHTITIRGKEIGTLRPKVIVPIVATSQEDILAEANTLCNAPLDFIEWRADFFDQVATPSALTQLLQALRTMLGNTPLLVTYRRKIEGGEGGATPQEYALFCKTVVESNCADLLDLESSIGKDDFCQLLTTAHQSNLPIIASHHNFDKTPPTATMVNTLCEMASLGADIAKLAVMPHNQADLANLLSATATAAEQCSGTPLVTMSMSALGQASRVCGASVGSTMTFASYGTASAPGQVELDEMNTLLDILYGPRIQ